MTSLQSQSKDSLEISYWLVSFLDMLGYGDALDRMDEDLDEASRERLIEAVKTVVNKRRLLQTCIENLLAGPGKAPPDAIAELVRQEGISEAAACAWMRPSVSHEVGGDHVFLACNMAAIGGRTSLHGPYFVFVASAASMLIQLASSAGKPAFALPLRGGMHVAPGMVWPDDRHLYSAARSRAVALETKCAVSPRTVLSDKLVHFLTTFAKSEGLSVREQVNTAIAREVLRFVIKEEDQFVLDFYGPAMAQFAREGGIDRTLAKQAWQAASEGLEHAKNVVKEPRVVSKWQYLVDYMRPRLTHWTGPSWRR